MCKREKVIIVKRFRLILKKSHNESFHSRDFSLDNFRSVSVIIDCAIVGTAITV